MKNCETSRPIQSEVLDQQWYMRFEDAGSFQAYEYLDGDKKYREEQKQKFISGEIDNPILDYLKIDRENLSRKEEVLLQLKKDIIEQELNETVKQAYRWKLNEKIAELRMLRAVANGDMRRFQKYSEFIYGKPSSEVFFFTINSLRETIEPFLSYENPDIKITAEELSNLLPSNLPKVSMSELPSEDNVDVVRRQTLKEVGALLDIKPAEEGKQYTADEIRDIFQHILDKLQTQGWNVIVDTGSKTAISVDQEHKLIKIPEARKLDYEKLRTLVAHEVGTHVTRRLKGERSHLHILGLGLDRYEKGEEGVATMREQVLGDKIDDFAGLEGHLAISLAAGLDGQPRDFRAVYTILEKYFYLTSLSSGKSPDTALTTAQNSAWNRAIRTFRGTNCLTKGSCFTKDIVYREGNIGVWEVIRQNPDELLRLSVGKYDPANKRHIWILDQLGISDADLGELKNLKNG